MHSSVVELSIVQFSLVYLLLLIVLAIMKKCRINRTRLLVLASVRMTVQLVLAGLVLTYIFQNPHPLFTMGYIAAMSAFALHRVLSNYPSLNRRFKLTIVFSFLGAGLSILAFFVLVVVGVNIFNPQYVIPIGGMVLGNAMTGLMLALKTFTETLRDQQNKVETLLNLGVRPKKILLPFANNALETALLPTLNSMLGMGIISLPGMMTGQILSGTLPGVAILYQIAVMVAVSTVICLTVFCSLYFGLQTLYNKRNQIAY